MVAHSFHNGDKAYIIDNVRFLREVIVLRVTRDLCVIRYIDNFDLSLSGTICVTLSDGTATYVSRRYVSKIKQVLGL